MTGSMRLRAFSIPEVVSQFDFRTMKKKRPNVNELSERMKTTSTHLSHIFKLRRVFIFSRHF